MSKLIPLTRGLHAIVDDDDYDFVMRKKWHLCPSGRRTIKYAKSQSNHLSQESSIMMHRYILGLSKTPPYVDHINGDGLDNRRKNLRVCSISENNANTNKHRGKSKYKGVDYRNSTGNWRACIHINNKTIHLGVFKTQEEAAEVYDRAAFAQWGAFAKLNLLSRRVLGKVKK